MKINSSNFSSKAHAYTFINLPCGGIPLAFKGERGIYCKSSGKYGEYDLAEFSDIDFYGKTIWLPTIEISVTHCKSESLYSTTGIYNQIDALFDRMDYLAEKKKESIKEYRVQCVVNPITMKENTVKGREEPHTFMQCSLS